MQNYMAYFKYITVTLLVLTATTLQAQSLKDALFSGRLKSDSTGVVKKGDSLQLRTTAEARVFKDSMQQVAIADAKKADSLETIVGSSIVTTVMGSDGKVDTIISTPITIANKVADPNLDNNAIWKKFIDQYKPILDKEVAESNRIKKGIYSVLIEYDIEEDGTVSTNKITSDPKNSALEDMVNKQMMFEVPPMHPVLGPNGKPRKLGRRQLLSFTKN